MKKVGLYFGSFNPIHIGHLVIANHMAEYAGLDEIWLVVTPHNPLKKKSTLLADHHRYAMVELATQNYYKIKPSNIEFKLPQPNYTIDTLAYLSEMYPEVEFSLIMGEDNLNTLPKWKNFETLLQQYTIFVYPRIYDKEVTMPFNNTNVVFVDAPVMEISSTAIRNAIKQGKNVQSLLPELVWKYIDEMNFYK